MQKVAVCLVPECRSEPDSLSEAHFAAVLEEDHRSLMQMVTEHQTRANDRRASRCTDPAFCIETLPADPIRTAMQPDAVITLDALEYLVAEIEANPAVFARRYFALCQRVKANETEMRGRMDSLESTVAGLCAQ